MAAVTLTVEAVRGGDRTRLAVSGAVAEVAALYRELGCPGLGAFPGGGDHGNKTTVINYMAPELVTTQESMPRAG